MAEGTLMPLPQTAAIEEAVITTDTTTDMKVRQLTFYHIYIKSHTFSVFHAYSFFKYLL